VRTLNLGILAHVDAGKTTLTERLLYAAGVIDEVGSVDDGSTQTDSLALERQRGITIKAAVVSFPVGDVTVNLIDTPGHPDFIAEVERVLGVLDGAVLVLSAVEGVQAQTRVLMRTLQWLAIPALLFVNKIDRPGADVPAVLESITRRLTPAVIAMGSVSGQGTPQVSFVPSGPDDPRCTGRLAEVVAEHDDALLAAYLDDPAQLPYRRLARALAAQTRGGLIHPVFCGSAVTGAGIGALSAGLTRLLPAADRSAAADGPVSGTVFKIERGPAGEKIAYARMFSGTVRVRGRIAAGQAAAAKVTAISVFGRGQAVPGTAVGAGQIGKLWGLAGVQVGDALGQAGTSTGRHHFAPPSLETVVVPDRPSDKGALHAALTQLAEQDPLISLRQHDGRSELLVSQYGEVQKEVTDIAVTMTHSGYYPRQGHAHAHFDKSMSSTAGDFRNLTPLVLMAALSRAGTTVCEPVHAFALELPADLAAGVLPALSRFRAIPLAQAARGALCTVEGEIPAAEVHRLQQQLPGLSRGEGVLDSAFDHYRPLRGEVPVRPRAGASPLNREEYLLRAGRAAAGS